VTTSRAAVLLVAVSAGVTAVVAAAAAAVRTDVKGALALSTSAQMGFMLLQCAAGLPGAAMLHFAGHAMYKASSFLGAGDEVRRATRRRHAPAPRTPLGPVASAVLAAVLPAAALAAAVAGLQAWVLPHGGGPVIVGVLWLALAHATWGWLRRPAAGPSAAVGMAAAGNLVIAVAYLSAASVLERFLWPVVGPASEGWLSPTAVAVAGVAVVAGAAGVAAVPTLRRIAFAAAQRFAHLPAPARRRVDAPSEPAEAGVPALRSAW
jgi:NADH:ubiquinone oxidoreductase subunit 5 (subunit L)/multisubunit Na+/H+ antiporter MnhA subunit